MSFGASAYASTSFGGNANSVNEQVFFPLVNRIPDTLFEARAVFGGASALYQILTQQGSEGTGPAGIEYKVYNSQDEGEPLQLQVTVTGNGQTIIGSASIIVVTAVIDSAVWPTGQYFTVKGRPYP